MESTTVAVKPSAPQHPEGPAEATNTAERAPSTAPAPAADDAQTEAVPDVSESQPGASHPPMPPPHHSGPPPPWHYGPPPPHVSYILFDAWVWLWVEWLIVVIFGFLRWDT